MYGVKGIAIFFFFVRINTKIMLKIDFKNRDRKIIWVILILLFLACLGTFIATSWYSIDLAASQKLDNSLQNEWGKFWSQYYSASGNTELISIMIILFMVLFESLFIYFKKSKPASLIGKNYNVIYIFYGVVFIGWIIANWILFRDIRTTDSGFGVGIDNEVLDSYKYKYIGKWIGTIIQTSFIGVGFYVVHFKLKFRQDFLIQAHWIRASKALVFFGISYLAVMIFKIAMERQYFYNVEFANFLVDKLKTNPDMVVHYLSQDSSIYGLKVGESSAEVYKYFENEFGSEVADLIKKYMGDTPIKNFYVGNIPGEWSWWKSNAKWMPDKIIDNSLVPHNKAFPSGHVDAAFCAASIMFLFMDIEIKNRKIVIFKWTMLTLGFINIINMIFAVVVMRWHWMSDVTFTTMWCIISIPLSHLLVNKVINTIIKKKSKRSVENNVIKK